MPEYRRSSTQNESTFYRPVKRGYDAEQVDRDIAAERARERALGLDFRRPGSPAQGVQALQGPGEDGDNDDDTDQTDKTDDAADRPRDPEDQS